MQRLVLVFLIALASAPAFAQQPPPPPPGTHIVQPKPSGFWGKGERGKGAYRWKLLGIGVGICVIAGLGMRHLVRKANAERAARAAAPRR